MEYNNSTTNDNEYVISLLENEMYQEILGFGGAFTDSAGFNINLMEDEALISKIIEAYYSPVALDYSLGRLNMGGCDFSTRSFLKNFLIFDKKKRGFSCTKNILA